MAKQKEETAIEQAANVVTVYDPQTPAVFGKHLVQALVLETTVREEIAEMERRHKEVYGDEGFLLVNLIQAVMKYAETDDDFDPRKYLDEIKARGGSMTMETFLIHLGIKERHKFGERDVVLFAEEFQTSYDYSAVEAKTAEYDKRKKAYQKLTIYIGKALKAAAGLYYGNVTNSDALAVVKDDNEPAKAVMHNGPAEIMGDKEKDIPFGARKPVDEKATYNASVAGLIKFADDKHTEQSAPAAGEGSQTQTQPSGEQSAPAPHERGDGATEDELATLLNSVTKAVRACENKMSDDNVKRATVLVGALLAVAGVKVPASE